MTIGQLIKKLQVMDPNLPVVIRSSSQYFPDDFVDLNSSDLAIMDTKKVFNEPHWEQQIYDASEGIQRPVSVLSLSGPTRLQRSR
jgi:hypothetical protein